MCLDIYAGYTLFMTSQRASDRFSLGLALNFPKITQSQIGCGRARRRCETGRLGRCGPKSQSSIGRK